MDHGHSRSDILNYTLSQVRGFLDAIQDSEKRRKLDLFITVSAAFSDQKSKKEALKMLGIDVD